LICEKSVLCLLFNFFNVLRERAEEPKKTATKAQTMIDESWFDKEHHDRSAEELINGSVDTLNGIGTVLAKRLAQCNVSSVRQLARWNVCWSAVKLIDAQHRDDAFDAASLRRYKPLASFVALYSNHASADAPLEPCDQLSAPFIRSLKRTVGSTLGALANWPCFVAAVKLAKIVDATSHNNDDDSNDNDDNEPIQSTLQFIIDKKATPFNNNKNDDDSDDDDSSNDDDNDSNQQSLSEDFDNDDLDNLLGSLQQSKLKSTNNNSKQSLLNDDDIAFNSENSQNDDDNNDIIPKIDPKRTKLLQKGLDSGLKQNVLLTKDRKS
jgi:hypothetical protein